MKAIALISGGKDSFLALLIAASVGMEVVSTITVKPEQDSYMFHYPNAEMGAVLSETMGIENVLVEESAFENSIEKFRGFFLVAGAVESEFQKTRLEMLCEKFGLIPFFPLWRKDQDSIMKEFISTGATGIFVSVAAEGLGSELLGMKIDRESLSLLKKVRERYGISLVGEGGEYETLVTCFPPTGRCIKITSSEVIDRGIQKSLMIRDYQIIPP